ncbi:hypothetical protein ACSBR1_010041 [Camellia fascicularis]
MRGSRRSQDGQEDGKRQRRSNPQQSQGVHSRSTFPVLSSGSRRGGQGDITCYKCDAKVCNDPTSFKPERFASGEVEGHKLMPFGMEKRTCPGASLAQRVVGLALGSLIQCFEWERVTEKVVDLTEGIGLTMFKVESL